MIFPLCSLARNPDGTIVRPTPYEINAAISNRLALAALGLLVILVVLAAAIYRVRSRRSGLVVCAFGALFMAVHPAWTVDMYGGDCGYLRQACSWLVLGLMGIFVATNLIVLAWPPAVRDAPDRLDFDDYLPGREL